MKFSHRLLGSAALGLLLPGIAVAQVVLTVANPTYGQAFNSLPIPAVNGEALAWTNNSTLTGWLREMQISTGAINNTLQWSEDGSVNNSSVPALFNYGSIGSGDRALGMRVTTNQGGSIGVVFHNQTGLFIDSLTVSYNGEQWRKSGQTITTQLLFGYQAIPSFDAGVYNLALATDFTAVPALNFVSPIFTASGGSLNGNSTANRADLNSTIVLSTPLAPGEFLVLRWRYDPPSASGHGLAIDNVNVAFTTTTIPEPGAVAALAGLAALGGVMLRRRRVG